MPKMYTPNLPLHPGPRPCHQPREGKTGVFEMHYGLHCAFAAAALLSASAPAGAVDAVSAFTNSGATAPFGYGGFNAGPASYSSASDCLGIVGFECRQNVEFETKLIGRVDQAKIVGAATLDPNYLNVLTYRSGGPSVGISYFHEGSEDKKLRASFKLLADPDTESLVVFIYRLSFQFGMPTPVELARVTATAVNSIGSFETVISEGGSYGVGVTRSYGLPIAPADFTTRRDWIGLNLEALSLAPAVPEPSSWALMIVGFGLTGVASRTQWRRERQRIPTIL